jgi:hypothetical protein
LQELDEIIRILNKVSKSMLISAFEDLGVDLIDEFQEVDSFF